MVRGPEGYRMSGGKYNPDRRRVIFPRAYLSGPITEIVTPYGETLELDQKRIEIEFGDFLEVELYNREFIEWLAKGPKRRELESSLED